MGNFVNTTYKDTVNSITNITKDILKNPYYIYNNLKAFEVEYYHINKEKSTMDESARIPYAYSGEDCPFRFNLIHGMYLYGDNKIQLSLENGEQGLESGDITGEAIILPNTITPYVGDYFEIVHTGDTWLFRVNDVQKDTLDDGANIWKIGYKLEHTDNSSLMQLVDDGDEYTMIVQNVGTNYNPIIKSDKYRLLEVVDTVCVELKRYYRELFYSQKVQTFIFVGVYGDYFYDPYMVEFLIRNKILANSGQKDYVYIDHKLPIPATFSLDYNKTFFRSFEQYDKEHLMRSNRESTAEYINNPVSIFNSRPEEYFEMNYKVYRRVENTPNPVAHNIIECFPTRVVDAIMENSLLEDINDSVYNIFVKYFNDIDYCEHDFDIIENVDYNDSKSMFYLIPLLIFCLESYIKKNLLR